MKNGSSAIPAPAIYQAVWRWHFYAGLYVLPFLFLLSLSGLLMLVSKPLELWMQEAVTRVSPQAEMLPASALLSRVRAEYPDATLQLYIPPGSAESSAQFTLRHPAMHQHGVHAASSTTVYVNPYNANLLGDTVPATSVYNLMKELHSSLFLGDVGDILLEIAAGLAILMIVSGLYLAWPRAPRPARSRSQTKNREDWRHLHRISGWLLSIPLLFLLISGLAWTNVWGGKLVQAWSSLPGTSYQAPQSVELHQASNISGQHHVPWAVEQTPLPLSSPHHTVLELDTVADIAKTQGFDRFRIHFPQGEQGVWTISATTMAGDISNPLAERILHLDPSSGAPLADIKFADYPLMGQAMSAFIPLHQGDLGWWNWWLNFVVVLLVLVLLGSGAMLWWRRRPRQSFKLAPPAAKPAISNAVLLAMLVIALCFPLSALALVVVSIIDYFFISKVKRLRALFK